MSGMGGKSGVFGNLAGGIWDFSEVSLFFGSLEYGLADMIGSFKCVSDLSRNMSI